MFVCQKAGEFIFLEIYRQRFKVSGCFYFGLLGPAVSQSRPCRTRLPSSVMKHRKPRCVISFFVDIRNNKQKKETNTKEKRNTSCQKRKEKKDKILDARDAHLIIIEWKEAIHSPLFDCVCMFVCVRVYSFIPPPNAHAPYNVYRLQQSAGCLAVSILYLSAL